MTAPSLPEFILAREGELRAAAEAVLNAHEMNGWESYIASAGMYTEPVHDFAVMHDPARVLRQCDAIRAIVEDLIEYDAEYRKAPSEFAKGRRFAALLAASRAASIWSDHPDYRQEWAA